MMLTSAHKMKVQRYDEHEGIGRMDREGRLKKEYEDKKKMKM